MACVPYVVVRLLFLVLSLADNSHEMSNLIFSEKYRDESVLVLWCLYWPANFGEVSVSGSHAKLFSYLQIQVLAVELCRT